LNFSIIKIYNSEFLNDYYTTFFFIKGIHEMSNNSNNRITELEQEVYDLYNVIEQLEEEIMKKDEILRKIEESGGSNKKFMKALKIKQESELQVKDNEIRELKNKLGHMRKEKIQIQLKLDKLQKQEKSTVIPIEEIRKEKPFKFLIGELEMIISKLRNDLTAEIQNKLNRAKHQIEVLKKKIAE